ncbi:MAG: GlsB/YeaQ/YmgE family stress response membrane protein [Pseudomonadota bacterium]
MEEFFQALGTIGLIFLLVVGVLAGLIASVLEGGRNKGRNIVIGVVGALLLPFLVAALATGALAAGGLALILITALIGAVAVLIIARLIFR